MLAKNLLKKNHRNIFVKDQSEFSSKEYDKFTVKYNQVVTCNDDNKEYQTLDKITTYPYRTSPFVVCFSELEE